ncbi:TnsA endonuclease N-terminal domain-containing protein [Mesobacillus sp.]|uniref:TnsA endonuclease N-terminal domain-containing protein n=1 Tax=Mesobacillus sp. TaxID=2675271 RepID=UPI0039EFA877
MIKARKIKPSKKVSIRGKHRSQKMSSMIPWESTLERDYLKIAEFDSMITYISSQPISITYLFEGKEKTYFPDFLIKTRDFKEYLVEVKPESKKYLSENQIKFQAGMSYAKENGIEFRILSEKDIRKGFLLENLDLLTDSRFEYTDVKIMNRMLDELRKSPGGITIGSFRQIMKMEQGEFILNLYYLIYSQKIKADLEREPITNQSLIFI